MTKEALSIYEINELAEFDANVKPLLDDFMKKLSLKPNEKVIKTNPFSQNAKYIPIEVIESALDSIFQGLWKVDNLQCSIQINSIVVSLDLHVLHPITRTWLTRSGIGAVPVELDKVTKEVNSKALHKNVPAAKAFAFRNAAQSLGRRFGRNLNRSFDFNFTEDTSNFKSIFDEKD